MHVALLSFLNFSFVFIFRKRFIQKWRRSEHMAPNMQQGNNNWKTGTESLTSNRTLSSRTIQAILQEERG